MLILKAFGQNILTDALSKIFGKILRTIFLALDSIIYSLISYLYRIFTFLSQIRLFENPRMQDLADRVYIIVGVVALFLVAYALISAIINPDNATKGKNSSFSGIVKNLIFAIIGIAIVPSVFDYAYEFQNRILCSNVINKFFAVPTGTEDEGTNFSNEMALTLFQSFYYVKQTDGSSENNKNLYNGVNSDDGEMTLTEAFEFINKGDKSIFEALGDFDDAFDNGQLGYLYLVSTVAGLYCAYVLLGFVIDIAVRSVKLSYLQLVAPLPIMTLVIPNQKKVFDNWLKKATSCFLEVFVRVIAIAFAAYSVRYLPEYVFSNKMPTCNGGISGIILLLAKAAFIIGIFGFLKQAPKLIGELFPGFDSKGFKLGFKDSFAEVGGFRALGATGGAITSGLRNIRASGTNIKNAWNKPLGKTGNLGRGVRTAGALFGAAASGVAGAASGGIRAFSNGKDAKKWSDSVKFAGEGADAAMEAKLKREDFKEKHKMDIPLVGGIVGAAVGHGKDAIGSIGDWINAPEATFKHAKVQHETASAVINKEKAIKDFAKEQRSKEENKSKLTNEDGETLAGLEFETAKAETKRNEAMKAWAAIQNEVGDDSFNPTRIQMERTTADNEVAAARRAVQQAQNGIDFHNAKQNLEAALAKQSLAYAKEGDFSKTVAGVKQRQEALSKALDDAEKQYRDAKDNQTAAEKYIDERIENGDENYIGQLSKAAQTNFENMLTDFRSTVEAARSLVPDNTDVSSYLSDKNERNTTTKDVASIFKKIDDTLVGQMNQYSESIRKKSEKK